MRDFIKCTLVGMIQALIYLFLLCAVISALMLFVDIPEDILSKLSVVLISFLSYASAYFSTQIKRTKGLSQGLLCGSTAFVFIFILGLISKNISLSELMPTKMLACVVCGIIGGIKGINTKHTKRYK